jgi:methyl-accepting chemotaxis protein
VQRAIQGFGRVRESVAQSTTVIRDMDKRAHDISSIVDTINLIAERTNLLSLNASIEAARAGDAGRGFAVVAEEIRNLADRSAKATADIAAIIKALQDVAQEAVSSSNEGLRVIDESNVQAEEGAKGLRKIMRVWPRPPVVG